MKTQGVRSRLVGRKGSVINASREDSNKASFNFVFGGANARHGTRTTIFKRQPFLCDVRKE